jgi:uncharacterized protein (TIGR03435 family)
MRMAWMTALLAASLAAQASFEVASVRSSPIVNRGPKEGERESIEPSAGGLAMRGVSLRSSIRWAYGLQDFQISAPGWLESQRYDIVAKAPGAVSDDELRLMLRALLTERFRLAVHRETRELQVYALAVGKKGTPLEAAKTPGEGSMQVDNGALVFRNMTMPEFAVRLAARPFGVDRPVIDRTGLPGAFDFSMKLAANNVELKQSLERRELERDFSMFTAPLEELGFRLKAQKAPVEILVVDHADKVPMEN